MAKSSEITTELKKFNSVFNKLTYKYEFIQVFDDLLTIIICCFARETQEELYFKTIKKYSKQELNLFVELFAELTIIYNGYAKSNTWGDPLGDFYEVINYNSKRSNLNQFFTPKSICDLISHLNIVDKDDFGKKIHDPACGSGRLLLSANNYAKGNYYICNDIDPMCCKMTAINFCFHDIKGEIHCMDTFKNEKPFFSLFTNFDFWKTGAKSIFLHTN